MVVPVARELFFRGILYGGLRRRRTVRSALLATSRVLRVLVPRPAADPDGARARPRAGVAARADRHGARARCWRQLAFGAVDGIPILRGRDPAADVTYPTKWIRGGAVIAVLALGAVAVGEPRQ